MDGGMGRERKDGEAVEEKKCIVLGVEKAVLWGRQIAYVGEWSEGGGWSANKDRKVKPCSFYLLIAALFFFLQSEIIHNAALRGHILKQRHFQRSFAFHLLQQEIKDQFRSLFCLGTPQSLQWVPNKWKKPQALSRQVWSGLPLQVQAWPGDLMWTNSTAVWTRAETSVGKEAGAQQRPAGDPAAPLCKHQWHKHVGHTHTFTQCLAKIILFQRILTQSLPLIWSGRKK